MANMSQQELADSTGLSQSKIAKIETCQRKCTLDDAVLITKALNVSMDVFCAEEIEVKI
jgi:predicted transcriptional regulator